MAGPSAAWSIATPNGGSGGAPMSADCRRFGFRTGVLQVDTEPGHEPSGEGWVVDRVDLAPRPAQSPTCPPGRSSPAAARRSPGPRRSTNLSDTMVMRSTSGACATPAALVDRSTADPRAPQSGAPCSTPASRSSHTRAARCVARHERGSVPRAGHRQRARSRRASRRAARTCA